jgi:membrane protein YdbS with pleckstrin-like domain
MLASLKHLVATVMKVPPEPHDPMGDVQSLRVFRAAKKYFYYRCLAWLLAQVVLFVVLGCITAVIVDAMLHDRSLQIFAPIMVASFVASFFLVQFGTTFFIVWLEYEMRWYKVSDRSLRIRYGVWNVREHTVTFANIQNISVTQGPVQRLFGIADVCVDTAGGGASAPSSAGAGHFGLVGLAMHAQQQAQDLHRAVFRGVDNGEEIRDLMLVRLRRVRDAGLGETVETAEPSTMPAGQSIPTPGLNDALNVLDALRQEAIAFKTAAQNLAR